MPPLNLILLIGQSNMCGRGFPDTVPPLKDPRIRMFRLGRWSEAAEPLFIDKATAGIGPAMSFSTRLLETAPEAQIGLIPCAFGGTKLHMWQPGEDLYEHAVALAKLARRQGRLRAILWHQGEGDSGDPERAGTYGARFAGMIARLRDDLEAKDVPVIAGELGEFLKDRPGIPHFTTINQALREAGNVISNYACVSAAGLSDIGDHLHFNAPSQRIFGERYAEAFLKLTGVDHV
jgi:hypothetical protein